MIVEEYGPEIIYIKGSDSIVADFLSHWPMLPDSTTEVEVENTSEENFYFVRQPQASRMSPCQIAQCFECFATNNDAHYDDNECPIAYHIICNHQTNDCNLQQLLAYGTFFCVLSME